MAELKFCFFMIAIFAVQLSFTFGIPIVKDSHSSGEQDEKKENSIAQLHQDPRTSRTENSFGEKESLITSTTKTVKEMSPSSSGITRFTSNPVITVATEELSSTILHSESPETVFTYEPRKNILITGGKNEVTGTDNIKDIETTASLSEVTRNRFETKFSERENSQQTVSTSEARKTEITLPTVGKKEVKNTIGRNDFEAITSSSENTGNNYLKMISTSESSKPVNTSTTGEKNEVTTIVGGKDSEHTFSVSETTMKNFQEIVLSSEPSKTPITLTTVEKKDNTDRSSGKDFGMSTSLPKTTGKNHQETYFASEPSKTEITLTTEKKKEFTTRTSGKGLETSNSLSENTGKNSQETVFRSIPINTAFTSTTDGRKEITTTTDGKDFETTNFLSESTKKGTENNFPSPSGVSKSSTIGKDFETTASLSNIRKVSTTKPITKHLLENNIKESQKLQVNDYREKIQSVHPNLFKIVLPVKDIDSKQVKTGIYSKENAAQKNNTSASPATNQTVYLESKKLESETFTENSSVTTTIRNLVPSEVTSKIILELEELMTKEPRLNKLILTNFENDTLNPVKDSNMKNISTQNNNMLGFVQNLLQLTNESDPKKEKSRNRQYLVKENIPSQKASQDSLDEVQTISSTPERNKILQNLTSSQENVNPLLMFPLLLISSLLKKESNIGSVENALLKTPNSNLKLIPESSTTLALIGNNKHSQEESMNQEFSNKYRNNEGINHLLLTPIYKNILLSTDKLILSKPISVKNAFENSSATTEKNETFERSENITDVLQLMKQNNENETFPNKESQNKEIIMDDYTRFLFRNQETIKDPNNSNFSNTDFFFIDDIPTNTTERKSTAVSSSGPVKPMFLFFLNVFSSWHDNFSIATDENSTKEGMWDRMKNGEFENDTIDEDSSENGTVTVADETEALNLAKKCASSVLDLSPELTENIIVIRNLKNSTKLLNKNELKEFPPKDASLTPENKGDKTGMNNNMDLESNSKIANKNELLNLPQKDASSIPNTAELITEMAFSNDLDTNSKVENKSELQNLAQKDNGSNFVELTTVLTVHSDSENNSNVAKVIGMHGVEKDKSPNLKNKDLESSKNHFPLFQNLMEIPGKKELFKEKERVLQRKKRA